MMTAKDDASSRHLVARGVGVHFEGLVALEDVDVDLARGKILGLIGPNGAGKTTLVNVLSGFQKPASGRVFLDGNDATRWTPYTFARRGLSRTFQAARLFPDMTVMENAELAAAGTGLSRRAAQQRALEMLDFVGLSERASVRARALAYGEERLVGIARALSAGPSFLLLDEPAAGLSPHEAGELLEKIAAIRENFGCGILVIEHNMPLIMELCDSVQVLSLGKTIAVGSPREIQSDSRVRAAYLGSETITGIHVAKDERQKMSPAEEAPFLDVKDLVVDYGAVRALSKVSMRVGQGEFVSVIGPNGAGKSTLLAAITGLVHPRSGRIDYEGRSIIGETTERRVQGGIALVPEGRRILTNLTVEENLRVGATLRRNEPEAAQRLDDVLERFPVLRARYKGYAGRLSGGEQQQLAIARALLSAPKLLLLDEPSLGLAPMIIEDVYEILVRLNQNGLSILLMEQNASRALQAGDRAYVLRNGIIELEGNAEALRDSPAFDRAYFGFEVKEGVPAT